MTLNEDIGYNYDLEKELQGEYTLKDYYALPDNRRVELIDGLFYDMASPKTVHQDIVSYIHVSLYEYIRDKKKPCKVFESPVDVQLDCDDKTMLEPDVIVVCDRDKIKEFGIYGAPDFILEVISKSSRQKDMTIKLRKYQAAGVREYWIIDPYKEVLITYDLTDEDYIPNVHPLEGSVPVLISNGELEIDLEPVAESIRELVKQIKD
jgi:Uma2 family endonuclease